MSTFNIMQTLPDGFRMKQKEPCIIFSITDTSYTPFPNFVMPVGWHLMQ